MSLKLIFQDNLPEGGLLFTFTGANKEGDRQAVQDRLIPFVSAHRAPAATPAPATPAPATSAAVNPAIAAVAGADTPGSLSTPGSPSTPGTPGTPASVARKRKADDLSPADAEARRRMNKVRERVLRRDPTLKMLHHELVLGRQITEDEFWDGRARQALLRSEELAYAQRPGRPSRLLDDRFDLSGNKKDDKIRGGTGVGLKKVESGPIVLNITKELTREIFEEFPVVQDAYAKNVPRISETDFWTRYFTSTLWERHRASVRKSALDEGARRKDDIFDVYLEDPDWGESGRERAERATVRSQLLPFETVGLASGWKGVLRLSARYESFLNHNIDTADTQRSSRARRCPTPSRSTSTLPRPRRTTGTRARSATSPCRRARNAPASH